MTLPTATSCLTTPLATLRTTLATIADLQTWVGVDSVEAALEHIHLQGIPLPPGDDETWTKEQAADLLPFVVLFFSTARSQMDAVDGDGYEFGKRNGQIEAYFFSAAEEHDPTPGVTEVNFLNAIGKILEGAENLAAHNEHFALTEWSCDGISGVKMDQYAAGTFPMHSCHCVLKWGAL
jgi:hypothetical protein